MAHNCAIIGCYMGCVVGRRGGTDRFWLFPINEPLIALNYGHFGVDMAA